MDKLISVIQVVAKQQALVKGTDRKAFIWKNNSRPSDQGNPAGQRIGGACAEVTSFETCAGFWKSSHQCFGPQISPIHANGRLEKIWGIGAICGLVLQVINGGGCLRDGFYKAAAPDGVWVSL
jgi:hypothetical protein